MQLFGPKAQLIIDTHDSTINVRVGITKECWDKRGVSLVRPVIARSGAETRVMGSTASLLHA